MQDEFDLYAREYDDYCKHEGDFRHAKGEEYQVHAEKKKKYIQGMGPFTFFFFLHFIFVSVMYELDVFLTDNLLLLCSRLKIYV